jgi:RNA polymerase sigma factor (TIGR02999 family)
MDFHSGVAMPPAADTTQLLAQVARGNQQSLTELTTVVYDELRAIATKYLAHEKPGHTLQPTALVHEAFLRLVNQREVVWKGRSHFYGIAAQMMRRILVDHARAKLREKRGGARQRITLREELTVSNQRDADVLAVEEALEKLAELDPVQAKIVELRFFGGMTVEEVAEVLGMSKRSVERHWTAIRAWLRRELSEEENS